MKRKAKLVLPVLLAFLFSAGLNAQSKGRPVSTPSPTPSPAPTMPNRSTSGSYNGSYPGMNSPLNSPDLVLSSEQDQIRREQRERLERALRAEQQKRIKSDTSELLELTAIYQHNLQQHGEATDADRKLLARIEKLAHDIKSRASGS